MRNVVGMELLQLYLAMLHNLLYIIHVEKYLRIVFYVCL